MITTRKSICVILSLMIIIPCGCAQQGRVLSRLPQPVLTAGVVKPAVRYTPTWQPPPREVTPVYTPAADVTVPAAWYPPGPARRWQTIVIHHSAGETGSADDFDRAHRARGWDELGYHFVIDNGVDRPDGLVEVGSRWVKQKHGAHCKTPDNFYNDYGIGICLVGNFENHRPSARQLQSLRRLLAFLTERYTIPASQIYGHGEVGRTKCPGRHMPLDSLRDWVASQAPVWAGSR